MTTEQVIKKEIELLLSESELAEETIYTILEWVLIRNILGKEPFLWAQLVLTIGNISNDTVDASLPGAVAMELYSLAADIFDDIEDQDNDELPWRQVPAPQAINMASCILVLSFKALSAIKDPQHYRQANETLQQMGLYACEGQFEEFRHEKQTSITLDQYFETIKKKAGALTAGACKIGAILGDCSETMIREFEQFGLKLGMISQVKNDLHDFLEFESKSDFSKGKKTLPLVYLFNVLEGSKAEELQYLCSLAQQDWQRFGPEERKQLRQLIIEEGAAHFCSVTCTLFKQQAMEILDGMKMTEEQKRKLIGLVGE